MPIIKEAWMPDGRQRPYQVCTRCIMDTTDPLIEFDADGVCNHCNYFDNNVRPNWFPNAAYPIETPTRDVSLRARYAA